MADKSGYSKREIYLKHIEYLEEELEKCQYKRDMLKKKHEDLSSRCSVLEKRHSDASEKLKLCWAERKKTEEELRERVESRRRAWEKEREALELQHSQRVQKLQEKIDELNSKIAVKSEELKVSTAKSEECEKQIMEHLSRNQTLEARNKAIVDKIVKQRERLQKLKTSRISEEEVKERAKTNAANILKKDRALHKEQCEVSQFLQTENAHKRKEIEVLQTKLNHILDEERKKEEMENEYKKKQELEDKKRVQKIKQFEVELRDLRATDKQLSATEKDLRRNLDLVSKENCQQAAKARRLETEIQKERNRIRQLEQVMWEGAIIIEDILVDPGDSEEMPTIEWKMERLLDIMESTAPIETDSDRCSEGQKLQSKTRKPARKL